MKLRMGDSCLSFIADEYPDDNRELRILAFELWLAAIDNKSDVDDDSIELEVKEILSSIDELYGDPSSHRGPVIQAKFLAYYLLGEIAFKRKNPELAIKYFEDCKGVMLSVGYIDMAMNISIEIAKAEGMLPGGCQKSSNEAILQLQDQIYAKSKKKAMCRTLCMELFLLNV